MVLIFVLLPDLVEGLGNSKRARAILVLNVYESIQREAFNCAAKPLNRAEVVLIFVLLPDLV